MTWYSCLGYTHFHGRQRWESEFKHFATRVVGGVGAYRFSSEAATMISVSCSCGRKFKAEDHHAGKRTRCPVCGNMLVIGQAPLTPPSGVSDNGEVPSWWFPGSSSPRSSMPLPPREPPPPTRSGSNPDDIQTAIVPRNRLITPNLLQAVKLALLRWLRLQHSLREA